MLGRLRHSHALPLNLHHITPLDTSSSLSQTLMMYARNAAVCIPCAKQAEMKKFNIHGSRRKLLYEPLLKLLIAPVRKSFPFLIQDTEQNGYKEQQDQHASLLFQATSEGRAHLL
jgi:hypothetical protein